MNKIIESEYKFGVESEAIIKPILEEKVGDLETTERYDSFDFVNNNFTIELKTRKNTKTKYLDTIIGKCKFNKADEILENNPEMRILFVFSFTDGIFYWEYNKEQANNFQERWIRRRDLGPQHKGQMYMLIPVNILESINNLN
mgnify:CR=1 FL=1|jgi:hypothetical protein